MGADDVALLVSFVSAAGFLTLLLAFAFFLAMNCFASCSPSFSLCVMSSSEHSEILSARLDADSESVFICSVACVRSLAKTSAFDTLVLDVLFTPRVISRRSLKCTPRGCSIVQCGSMSCQFGSSGSTREGGCQHWQAVGGLEKPEASRLELLLPSPSSSRGARCIFEEAGV